MFINSKWKIPISRVTLVKTAVSYILDSVLEQMKIFVSFFKTINPCLVCLGYIFHALVFYYSQLCYFLYHYIQFLPTYSAFTSYLDDQSENLQKTDLEFLSCPLISLDLYTLYTCKSAWWTLCSVIFSYLLHYNYKKFYVCKKPIRHSMDHSLRWTSLRIQKIEM